MKLRDSPVCETCPYNTTESLQHFLLECPAYKNIRDQSFQENVDSVNVFMSCLDFTELSPLLKLQFQGKQPYLSNVVDFQSSRLQLLARTNSLALNTTLNRMKADRYAKPVLIMLPNSFNTSYLNVRHTQI